MSKFLQSLKCISLTLISNVCYTMLDYIHNEQALNRCTGLKSKQYEFKCIKFYLNPIQSFA